MPRRLAALTASLLSVATVTTAASAQVEPPRRPVADITTATTQLQGTSLNEVDVPQSLAVAPNAVWVVYHRAGRVDRVDPDTNAVVASVEVPGAVCDLVGEGGCSGLEGIAADERNVWVVNNEASELVHIDARTNRVVGSIETNGDMRATPVIDGDSVWAGISALGEIVQISARRNVVTKTVHLGATGWPLAMVRGKLWAGSYDVHASPEKAWRLHRIDPGRARVTKTVTGVSATEASVVGDDLWLNGCAYLPFPQNTMCRVLRKVDGRTGAVEAEVPIGGFPAGIAALERHVVVATDTGPGVATPKWLTVVDAATATTTGLYDLPPADAPNGVASGHGSLWITDWSANTLTRVTIPRPSP
jgi:hypothetical protein